nr:LysM peptidoglycan-binding domain-containing protein [Actinopolymorpha pittospori]
MRRRVAGLFAMLTILGIIIGLPAVLLAVGANPFSGDLSFLEAVKNALTSPDDGTLAIGVIKLIAWASWAFLTLSILVEVISRARGVRVPRLPGLRVPQHAANGLVGTAMMLFVTLPSVAHAAPGVSAPPVVASQTVVTATPQAIQVTDTATTAGQPQTAAPAPARKAAAVKHTVQRGETLWSIAAEHLGDGRRYREIVELNEDLLDGKDTFIKAGWELDIPAPVLEESPGGTVVVEKGDTLSEIALKEVGDADRYPEIFEASRGITQPGGEHLSDPDVIDVGWTLKLPDPATAAKPAQNPSNDAPRNAPRPRPASETSQDTPAEQQPDVPEVTQEAPAQQQPAPSQSSTQQAPDASADEEHLQENSDWMVRSSFGVGALLAAGVLALLATRRRTQQRRRRPGQRIPMPSGHTAEVEQELRATADSLSVETVDVALRSLARTCSESGSALPVVRAARLTATQFDLYLAEPAQLPAPWTGTADTTVWTLDVDNTGKLEGIDVSDVPAPYPALVTIGHDEEAGHVFLDLEYLGNLGVAGEGSATREILAALAIELATSTWADDLQVTLVGAFPELEDTLQTGRIRYLPSVGRVLDDLLHRAEEDRRAMADAGVAGLHTARVTGAAPDAWSPEIVLIAGEVTDRQRNQLEQLVDDLPRVALATVTSGVGVGEWVLDLAAGADPDVAVLAPIGLQLQPQRLPAEQYGHLLHIASMADVEELDGAAAPELSLVDIESITPVDEPSYPASAMPEITLEVLEAAAEREEEQPSEQPSETATADTASAAVQVPFTGVPLLEAARPAVQATDPAAGEPQTQAPAAAVEGEESTPSDPVHPQAASQAPTEGAPIPGELEIPTEAETANEEVALVPPMPFPAPRVLVLGPVDMINTGGKVEPSKRARLLEFAAYLALHPGATHTAIDNAIWPDRKTEDNLNTRNPATSKLRRWVGTDPDGQEYLPRHQAGEGYAFLPSVTTDVGDWDRLLQHDPLNAPTENLEAALQLVRGIPFEGTHRKRYAWAEPIKQRLISELVDASYELTRRRLLEGRWRAAEQAVVVGLRIEPAQENLWRLRILAAHESRSPAAEAEAIERLLTITEQLECDLEPETERLLAALKSPGTNFDQLMANAL